MASAQELCLILNPSVNAYRRLDPHFEAPNQIKVSPVDRGSMIRIPLGNAKSARLEVRSVAPDTNPYLNLYGLLRTGLEGPLGEHRGHRQAPPHPVPPRQHPGRHPLLQGLQVPGGRPGRGGARQVRRAKMLQAERCPKALGAQVKASEIQFHHEVTNQYLWSQF